jgi:hypothetical protein
LVLVRFVGLENEKDVCNKKYLKRAKSVKRISQSITIYGVFFKVIIRNFPEKTEKFRRRKTGKLYVGKTGQNPGKSKIPGRKNGKIGATNVPKICISS